MTLFNEHMQATIDRGFEIRARSEAIADEKESEGEFKYEALERQFKNYGLDGELLTHCGDELIRIVLWEAADTDEQKETHPYSKPGGDQMRLDDFRTIRDQRNGWLAEMEECARNEFIEREEAA